MGRTPKPLIKNPLQILLERARAYPTGKHYVQLKVFTVWWYEAALLRQHYGGGIYSCGSGYLWIVSKRDTLCTIVNDVRRSLPSQHKFEELVYERIPETIKPSD